MKSYINSIKELLQTRINNKNKKKLLNKNPIIISSNCTGGFIYHWLGLKFRSPFINLFLSPEEFVLMCENINDFLNTPLKEINTNYSYPVGKGYNGIQVHFMYYKSFEEAIELWNKRLSRMERTRVSNSLSEKFNYNTEETGFIFSNWNGNTDLLRRFDELPFNNKVVFTDRKYNFPSSYYLKGYNINKENVYATQNIFGKRYINQFDYVSFLNSLLRR